MAKKQSRKSKMGVIVAVLLLAVGFAAVTTTLYINGTIKIVPDTEDFEKNVFFSAAVLDYSDEAKTDLSVTLDEPSETDDAVDANNKDGSKLIIDKSGKIIQFEAGPLNTINETATLKYTVKNASQYDAVLDQLVCGIYDAALTDADYEVDTNTGKTTITKTASTDDHLTLTVSDNTDTVAAKGGTSGPHTVEIKMRKSYVGESADPAVTADEEKTLYVACVMPVTAAEASTTAASSSTTVAGA